MRRVCAPHPRMMASLSHTIVRGTNDGAWPMYPMGEAAAAAMGGSLKCGDIHIRMKWMLSSKSSMLDDLNASY